MKTCSSEEFLNQYLQTLFSLDIAEKEIGFTHYDLHDQNVLVRNPGFGTFQMRYDLSNGQTYYVEMDKIATFIDYGHSHILYKDNSYGLHTYRLIPYCEFYDRVWTLHDSYKLLLFSAMDARKYNNLEVLNSCSRLLKFFNLKEDIDYIMDNQRQYSYC